VGGPKPAHTAWPRGITTQPGKVGLPTVPLQALGRGDLFFRASYHPAVTSGQDNDPDLERQRAEIEDTLRERWVPLQVGEPQVLTERAYTEARKTPARGRRAWLDQSIIEAVRDGAQPGDPLPPRRPGTFFDRGTDTEVFIIGRGPGRRGASRSSSPTKTSPTPGSVTGSSPNPPAGTAKPPNS
jgi:hypothetical protein